MAFYYMGTGQGKRKSDQSPYWYVHILRFNRWGQWAIEPVYMSEQQQKDVIAQHIEEGTPVIVRTEFGDFVSIEPHDQVPALLLDR